MYFAGPGNALGALDLIFMDNVVHPMAVMRRLGSTKSRRAAPIRTARDANVVREPAGVGTLTRRPAS